MITIHGSLQFNKINRMSFNRFRRICRRSTASKIFWIMEISKCLFQSIKCTSIKQIFNPNPQSRVEDLPNHSESHQSLNHESLLNRESLLFRTTRGNLPQDSQIQISAGKTNSELKTLRQPMYKFSLRMLQSPACQSLRASLTTWRRPAPIRHWCNQAPDISRKVEEPKILKIRWA